MISSATRDSHTKWSKSERGRQISYDITYIWNLIYGTNEPFHRKENYDLENRLVVAKQEGEGVGWMGYLGLIDANYCFWNELAMRSCCVALGTMSGHLWWSMIMWEKRTYTCMCNWVTMLYSRKLTEHCKPAIMEKNKIIFFKKSSWNGTFPWTV